MKCWTFAAAAVVLAALAFGSAGAQSGSSSAPGRVADDGRMQQMIKMMQDMQEQMKGMQGRMQGMQGMGSMHGGMEQMMAMIAQMQGMMQQHREQMRMQCPMPASPPPK